MDPNTIVASLRSWKIGTTFPLTRKDVSDLFDATRSVFMSQPMMLETRAPISIGGDLHGQFSDVIRLFDTNGWPPTQNYLFLGDYVDRGKHGLATLCLLYAFTVLYPENFFLLRGNHECTSICRIYGFYDEVKRLFDVKLWKHATDVFNCMPVCAVVEDAIFCTHGGLSPELRSLDQIRKIQRPTDVPDCGLLCDLLWSDPETDGSGWMENDKGVSFRFCSDVLQRFCDKFEFDLVVRAHQVVEEGYEFFAGRRLVTVFSAPNYCGEFDNHGAVMRVDDTLTCSFTILKASRKTTK
eukprot:PhF_6_TR802/c0_g1_i1/m.1223/K06269/PPP1C; serine/threonine-protein phosphatase PP1 catalytic subunit